MKNKSKTTFQFDRKRKLRCPKCTRYVTHTYLGEKNTRTITCECGEILKIPPPEKVIVAGEKMIKYGADIAANVTSDLT